MTNKCKQFLKTVLALRDVKLSEISCVECAGSYACEGLGYEEITAHCIDCARAEYILKNSEVKE